MSDDSLTSTSDRRQEFLLVRTVRNTGKTISGNISETTRIDYLAKYKRMKLTGFMPEDAKTKRGFYAYRAALLYGTAQEASIALRNRDNALHGSEVWKASIDELTRYEKIYQRYPPDPQRRSHAAGSPSFTWKSVKERESPSLSKTAAIKSKKQALSKLRRIPNWKEKLFQSMSSQYQDCLSVLCLTGARPSELARGVLVSLKYDCVGVAYLSITIKGTKVTAKTGQPVRTISVRICGAIAQQLALRASATTGQVLLVTGKPANLTAAVIRAGRKAFPALNDTVTPYVLRHSVASDMKAQPATYSPVDVAKVLGHQATETQQYYGYAACASKVSDIIGVNAYAPVRLTHRRPQDSFALPTAPAWYRCQPSFG